MCRPSAKPAGAAATLRSIVPVASFVVFMAMRQGDVPTAASAKSPLAMTNAGNVVENMII